MGLSNPKAGKKITAPEYEEKIEQVIVAAAPAVRPINSRITMHAAKAAIIPVSERIDASEETAYNPVVYLPYYPTEIKAPVNDQKNVIQKEHKKSHKSKAEGAGGKSQIVALLPGV